MNKEMIYRFFDDQLTFEEEEILKKWLDESEENRKAFFKEKAIYDAILFSEEIEEPVQTAEKKTPLRRLILREFLRTAAAVAIVLFIGYFYKSIQEKRAENMISMNTIAVPAGQYVQLTLSDNTKIWLNALTTMQYPAKFPSGERRIILNGEAYLEVSKDEKRPFIVETDKYQTTVLGTHFNVQAYKGRSFEAALLEGRIELSPKSNLAYKVPLLPHEIAHECNGSLHVNKIHDYDAFRWREGLLCFRNKAFTDIMYEFEKCFGVKIVINNKKVVNRNYIGKFRQTDGIDHALRVLQKNIYFKFERDEERRIIYIN